MYKSLSSLNGPIVNVEQYEHDWEQNHRHFVQISWVRHHCRELLLAPKMENLGKNDKEKD